ncbi:MAG: hypothetical protein U9P72_07515 [Campylobacterota bacterium]|nr:hypothetical protein [Campylobacterota bacterium]
MKLNNYQVFPFLGKALFFSVGIFTILACNNSSSKEENQAQKIEEIEKIVVTPIDIDFKTTISRNNSAAYVTSQCYTKTKEDDSSIVHNPCFSCHINSSEPNYIDDAELQTLNDFSDYTKVNRFTNLFKDRTTLVGQISDEEILSYVREDNYIENQNIKLAQKLSNIPSEWDVNDDGIWNGYMPDCYFNFDDEGFDRDKENNFTGWRAFSYYPFLGTFWPTNGSTDDVLIRLPKAFQEGVNGDFSKDIYKINLAIIESLIKQKDIQIDEVDENLYGVDLDQDGVLNIAKEIKYKWEKPTYNATLQRIENFSMSYVGRAKDMLITNEYLIAPGLYPKGSEFLHSVRYIDIDDSNSVKMASRMKELRYAKKVHWNSYPQLLNASMDEIMERDLFPDRLRTIIGDTERGLQTGLGWTYQGFIEDVEGELRPQNYEETQYCIGCHSGIGAIVDSTFVFQRKFDFNSHQNGWYHWLQDTKGFKNIKEPKTKDGRNEYSLYLEKNHAGDEFRTNDEVIKKFFHEDGTLKEDEISTLNDDISHLIIPSAKRALELNKAYKVIVDEQSYIYGRDAHIKPVKNVHKSLVPQTSTGNEMVILQ